MDILFEKSSHPWLFWGNIVVYSYISIYLQKHLNNMKMARKIKTFFQESFLELKKVHWPTAKEAKILTIAVLILAAFFGVILSLMDYGLGKLIYPLIIK